MKIDVCGGQARTSALVELCNCLADAVFDAGPSGELHPPLREALNTLGVTDEEIAEVFE